MDTTGGTGLWVVWTVQGSVGVMNSPDGVQNGVLSRGGWSIEVESIVGTTTCRTRRTDGQDESGSRRLDEGVDAI